MSSEPPLLAASTQPAGKVTPPGAVWSLVLGILSLFCLWLLGSIPAIILGALSIRKAKANPGTVGGEGLALAGIITGAIGLFTGLIAVGIMASIAIPAFNGVKYRAEETKSVLAVREVAMAVLGYSAAQPDRELPETLDDLIPEFLPDNSKLMLSHPDGTSAPIQYRKVDIHAGSEELILLLKLPGSNGYVLGYSDASIEVSRTPLEREVLESFEP